MARSEEELLESLSGDFRGLLDNKKVPKTIQAELARRGIDSAEMLAVLAEDRDELREAAKLQLGIDPTASPAQAVDQARLVVAWEAARQRMKVKGEQDAVAATERESKAIPTSEFLGLRRQFERLYYVLRDEEVPSRSSLEDLAEQLEGGDWRAMSLKEIAGKADVESEAQWGSLTVGKLGQVRLKKSAVQTPAPRDLEEFRQKLKLLGHHFVFLRMMQPNRREVSDITPCTFASYGDYMLSKRVARLASEDESGQVFHSPTLKQVLTYDFYIRKKMVELLAPDTPVGEALKQAMECPVTKERHFTTPLSVSAAAQAARSRSPGPPAASSAPWGMGKGSKGRKGKSKKGKGRGAFHSLTPEGRQICYAYNSASEACDGSCNRVHCCQVCFGSHPAYQHASESKQTARPPGGGAAAAKPAA